MHPLDEKYWSRREYWRWWGYVCPRDPRIIVSKHPRWAGYTVNFGHKYSLPGFLGIIFLMLLPCIACAHFAPQNEVLVFATLGIMLALLVAVCYRLANPRTWNEKETPNNQIQPIGGKDAASG